MCVRVLKIRKSQIVYQPPKDNLPLMGVGGVVDFFFFKSGPFKNGLWFSVSKVFIF